MIDHEKLDALLADHALGASPEGTDLLIAALAEKDSDIRRRLAEYQRVADLAKRCGPAEIALPPFPRKRLEQAKHEIFARRALTWATAAAACIAIGFFVGERRPAELPAVSPVSVLAPTESSDAPVADFWSVDRWKTARQEQLNSDSQSRTEDSWRDLIRAGRGSL